MTTKKGLSGWVSALLMGWAVFGPVFAGGAEIIQEFLMDTNPGWTTQGQWQFGRPQGSGGDPSSGYTGSNVYGYNLSGQYPDNMPRYWLTSTAIDCSSYENVVLTFYRWLGVESSSYDHAGIQVSNNGSSWVTVWEHEGSGFTDTSWTEVSYDISAVADDQSTVYVRWAMGTTDSSATYCGWNIDDVRVIGDSMNSLVVMPDSDFGVDVYLDEPVVPSNTIYAVSNLSASAVAWAVDSSEAWVSAWPQGGVLEPGQTVNVAVTIDSQGQGFPLGESEAILTFEDLARELGVARRVSVRVHPQPQPPAEPYSPMPAVDAQNVSAGTMLVWQHDSGSVLPSPLVNTTSTYRVYFGTNADELGLAASGLTNAAFDPGILEVDTTYYWQIVASNAVGTAAGPVWNFTTWSQGPLDHFEWDIVSDHPRMRQPFEVVVRAKDAQGHTLRAYAQGINVAGYRMVTNRVAILSETFDGANDNNWNLGSGYYTTNDNLSGSQCLVASSNFSGSASVQHDALQPDSVSFNIRSDGATSFSYVQLADSSYNTVGYFYVNGTNMYLSTGGPAVLIPFQTDRWYTVVLSINWEQRRMDWYRDDQLMGSGLPFSSSAAENLGRLSLYKAAAGEVRYDDFEYVDIEVVPSPLAVTLDSTPVMAAGSWTGRVTVAEYVDKAFLRAYDNLGHSGNSDLFEIDYLADLAVQFPDVVTEGDGTVSGAARVVVSVPPSTNLVVALSLNADAEIEVPATVEIPAGQTQAYFDFTVLDDTLLDGTQTSLVTAASADYRSVTTPVPVHDNETAVLSLSLPQSTQEGAGSIAGILTVGQAPDVDVVATLVSSNPGEIMGRQITIPAGQTYVQFTLEVVDDDLLDGMRQVEIEARVRNWTGSRATVFVLDNEPTALNLHIVPNSIRESDGLLTGQAYAGLSGTATHDVTLSLQSSDPSGISVPASITITAGQSRAWFDLAVHDNTQTEGARQVSITARASGYVPASDSVTVQDDDLHHLTVEGIPENQPPYHSAQVVVSAWTVDGQPLDELPAPITLSANGDQGPVILSPSAIANTAHGVGSEIVQFRSVGRDIVLVAETGTGIAGTSTVFNVVGPLLAITPADLENTLVVAGETLTRTMVLSNAGNAELEFEIPGADTGSGGGAATNSLDVGLVAHYPFNGNAADESGNGHDGTVNGATLTTDRFGNPDSAYDFNGLSAFINCGNIIDGFSNFTVSAWINIDTFSDSRYMGPWSQQRFAYQTDNSNYQFYTGHDTTVASFGTSMRWDDGILLNSRTVHSLPTHEWHLIAQSYDGNEVRQYDNGVLINTTVTGAHSLSNSWDFLIGQTCAYPGNLVTRYFDGQIDELRVYNRALSESEIQDLVNEANPAATNDLDAGLVASYPFNGDAADESGNGHDGTVNGATLTTDRFGNADSAYLFDGVNDKITVPDSTDLRLSGTDFTISTWLKETSASHLTQGVLINKRLGDGQRGWYCSVSGGNLYYQVSGGYDPKALGTLQIPLNDWNHIAATYDLETTTLRIYVNGALDSIHTSIPSPNAATAANMIIGTDSAGNPYWFKGAIDDLRIYNRALSESEIADLYDATDSDAGLIANYPFSGNAADESGNGHDGTVNGATLTADRFGNTNGAYYFDGVNDRIDLAGEPAFDFERTNSFSYSCWVKTDDITSGNKTLISKMMQISPYRGYEVYLRDGKIMAHFINTHNSNGMYIEGLHAINDGQWHCIMLTYDGSSNTGGISLYLDGALEGFSAIKDQLTGSILNDVAPALGARSSDWRFKGVLDDVRVYDRVLSESEVTALYADDGSGGGEDPEPEQISSAVYYAFDGDATDSSGNGADGIVEGAVLTEDRDGNPNSAYAFDEGAYIRTLAATGSVDIDGQISMSGWINPSQFETKAGGAGTMRTIMRKLSALSFYGYAFAVTTDGRLAFDSGLSIFPNTHVAATGMDPLPTNAWSHVAMTYNGSQVLFYVDGVLADTRPYSQPLQSGPAATLCIGRLSYEGASDYFYGSMDELRLFDSVLSAAEVAALYSGAEPPSDSWFSVDTASGTIPPGESRSISVTFTAEGMTAGDSVQGVLTLLSNDSSTAPDAIPVSMLVLPTAPLMDAEPESTNGDSNSVFWSAVDGPVQYQVEVAATTDSAALQQSDWISATNHTFGGLAPNATYYYRARASVTHSSNIYAGPWSDWVWSTQLPVLVDSDGDGLPDWWEQMYFGGPTNANPLADSDGDGQSDYDEYIAGMDPTNVASCFAIHDAAVPTNGQFVIYWDSVTGRVYSVHWQSALTNAFEPMATNIFYPQGSYTDTVHQAEDTGFYKIGVELQ